MTRLLPRETLLSTSSIYLFGRLLSDLQLVATDPEDKRRPARRGDNRFLEKQLRNEQAGLARIFAFSFEGYTYDLAKPALFLVHGGGAEIDAPEPDDQRYGRLSRSPGPITQTGIGRHSAAFPMDMRVWVYDKGDFSMRLDLETGSLEQILLSVEMDDESLARSSGSRSSGARSSGARSSGARSSGVMARSSGWMPRSGSK
jgi:hypothetical protein